LTLHKDTRTGVTFAARASGPEPWSGIGPGVGKALKVARGETAHFDKKPILMLREIMQQNSNEYIGWGIHDPSRKKGKKEKNFPLKITYELLLSFIDPNRLDSPKHQYYREIAGESGQTRAKRKR